MMLFLVTENCRVSSAHAWMTSSRDFRIANEGDSEQGG